MGDGMDPMRQGLLSGARVMDYYGYPSTLHIRLASLVKVVKSMFDNRR